MPFYKARVLAIAFIGERRLQMSDKAFNFAVDFWAKRFAQREQKKGAK